MTTDIKVFLKQVREAQDRCFVDGKIDPDRVAEFTKMVSQYIDLKEKLKQAQNNAQQ